MELKKNYLTIEELGNIVENMLEAETSWEREMVKVSLVGMYCTDGNYKEDDKLNHIYNDLAVNNILETLELDIQNYSRIDALYKDSISLGSTMLGLLGKLSIDDIKSLGNKVV